MSYLQFHALFTIPVLALVGYMQPSIVQADRRRSIASIILIAIIAFAYTTPWDNYLVAEGIWFYGTDRVLATVGHVPIEEYAFFIIQTAITGLWTFWLLHRGAHHARPAPVSGARLAGTVAFIGLAAVGFLALFEDSTRYFGLITVWAGPVLALQWAVGGHILAARHRLLAGAVITPTVYLSLVDLVAIRNGVWTIAPATSTGLNLFGLPVEEALFFLLTNMLVAQGVLLAARHLGHSQFLSRR